MKKEASSDEAHIEAIAKDDDPAVLEGGGSHNGEQYTRRTARLVRRIDVRILPLCAGIYLLNYLDRGNIGNSKVLNSETGDDLLQRTHMSSYNYAVALTLFSLAYALFEVPSNWVMKRYVRPSRWLAFLLFCWGVCTIGFAGVQNYAEVVIVRFLIGVFEAGFFPGIVFLITFWYRVEERSIRIAFVLASATLAGAFGGCIAYGVGHINGTDGLEAFRWLFVIEGLVTVVCAILLIFFLPNYPSSARWLSESDRVFAEDRLKAQGGGYNPQHATWAEIRETAFSPRMLVHYLAYVTNCVPLGSLTFFTPTIVKGLGYTSIYAQLMTVPPWAVSYVICLALAYSADRFDARGWHITVSSLCGGAGWLAAGLLPPDAYTQRYGCLIVAGLGAFPSASPLSAWVTCNVPTVVTMAIATALNNSAAGLSQIIAQWIWKADEETIGYPTGNFVCAGCSFATAAIATGLRVYYNRANKRGKVDIQGKGRLWLT